MTVWPQPDGAEPKVTGSLEEIGARLRHERLEQKISLREMARRIDVSPSFVSQVELGKARPSVGTLFALVSELNLSLDDLMQEPVSPALESASVVDKREWSQNSASFPWLNPSKLLRPAAGRPRIQLPGVTWERLTSSDDPMVEFLMVTYEVGGESCSEKHLMRHGGHEYGHIISGKLNVQVGFDHFELGPEDSIHFDSATPHRLANSRNNPEPCVSIWVVVGRRVDPRDKGSESSISHLPHMS